MKKRMFIVVLLVCAGCGGGQLEAPYRTLPLGVSPCPELHEATVAAVNEMNEVLGGVFRVSDSGEVQVLCDVEHEYTGASVSMDGKVAGRSIGDMVWVDCEGWEAIELRVIIIAHELFHSLGFEDHYDDPNCLNHASPVIRGRVADAICDEMVADFNAAYGDMEDAWNGEL